MQSVSTISLQAKISRAIHLARLRSYMLHLIHDPNDGDYLLLETVGPDIAYVYRTPEHDRPWMPLSAIPTTVQTPDSTPENYRAWITGTDFKVVCSHHIKAGILDFINNHPELLI